MFFILMNVIYMYVSPIAQFPIFIAVFSSYIALFCLFSDALCVPTTKAI